MTSPALQQAFELQYQASRQQVAVPAMLRKERLLRVQRMLDEHGAVLTAAVQADFGVRSVRLTEFADLLVLRTQLKQALRKLERWMRPRHVWTPLQLWPARARIKRQPLGVVGIIAPWNYPLQMALGPAIAALAAGNRVMLKPSELAPHTAAQLAAVVAQFFAPEEFCVVQGDSYVSTQFAGLPFDHLVFTGSTAVGRRVAQAAAVHLTPTTLELGGKSPCILGTDCDMQQAALRVAHGKLLNAGQTCIAPDYLLLPRVRSWLLSRHTVKPWPGYSPGWWAIRTMRPSSTSAICCACASCCSRPRPKGPRCRCWTLQREKAAMPAPAGAMPASARCRPPWCGMCSPIWP
jgi:coniferyl-aldehyde dehydrogenase